MSGEAPANPNAPYTLRAIFESVADLLKERAPGVGLAPVTTWYGAKYLGRKESPPRIVAVPTRGITAGRLNRHGNGVNQPWALWGRNVGLDLHIWGEDEDGAELLAWHFVAALHDLRGGLYEITGEEWEESTDDSLGQLVVLRSTIYTIWSREFIPAVRGTPQQSASVTQPS